jgi:hypothetical protein
MSEPKKVTIEITPEWIQRTANFSQELNEEELWTLDQASEFLERFEENIREAVEDVVQELVENFLELHQLE